MLFMPAFGATNSIPYVPRLFLIMSRTSHNELQQKLFCGVLGKKTPHLTSFSTIVEKLVVEEDYDAHTYGLIILQEYRNRNISLTKGCAKDIISPVECNNPVRKGGGCVGGL